MFKVVVLALLLSGCSYIGFGPRPIEPDVIIVRPPEGYTRAEVDAINAETNCRRLARNMLEAQRCGVRR